MDLYGRYQLLGIAPEISVRCFEAQALSSGKKVIVHFLPDGYTPETDRLLRKIVQLPPTPRASILEVGDLQGKPYVVTEVLDLPLPAWLDYHLLSKAQPAREAVEPPPEHVPTPVAAQPRTAEAQARGEFTAMFGRRSDAAPNPGIASEPARRAEPKEETGEFTRFFGRESNRKDPVVAPERPTSDISGLFGPGRDRLPAEKARFPEDRPPAPEIEHLPPNGVAAPEPSQFGVRPEPKPAHADIPAKSGRESPLDIIESWNETGYETPRQADARPAPDAPVRVAASGPSEYTRIVQAPPVQGEEKPLSPPVPPKPGFWTPFAPYSKLIGIMAALAVLAILMILYFAARS